MHRSRPCCCCLMAVTSAAILWAMARQGDTGSTSRSVNVQLNRICSQNKKLIIELEEIWTPICQPWCRRVLPCRRRPGARRAALQSFMRLSCGACPACTNETQLLAVNETPHAGLLPSSPVATSNASGWGMICSPACRNGYCDPSLGVCICLPGWRGRACDDGYMHACFLGSSAVRYAACSGFGGLMPCACTQQCARALGLPDSTAAKVCFNDNLKTSPNYLSRRSGRGANTTVLFWSARPRRLPFGFRAIAPWVVLRQKQGQRVIRSGPVAVLVEPTGLTPLPTEKCAYGCHGHGTCASLFHNQPTLRITQCICHSGFRGNSCEDADASVCMNSCSGQGQCLGRLCLCNSGWWGIDCSLSYHNLQAPARVSHASRLLYVPTFVYPLPTDLAMLHSVQGSRGSPGTRGMFQANRRFLEMLHARQDAIVADPFSAKLFIVPVMLTQRLGNMQDPQLFLSQVVAHLRTEFPFWNRTLGADHVFFTTQDLGGCSISNVIPSSIIVSHFGWTGTKVRWMNTALWKSLFNGSKSVENASAVVKGRIRKWDLRPPLISSSRRNSRHPAYSQQHLDGNCFDPKKDVVVPTDFAVSKEDDQMTLVECTTHRQRRILLFLAGSIVDTPGTPWYSQLVRQEFFRLHRNTPGVDIRVGRWSISDMRNATFCLCPSGVGFGWRVYIALTALCIPVIIQPGVQQAFASMVPYSKFSLSYQLNDVKVLPQLLSAIPSERICTMRVNAFRYRRVFMWQQPHGLAYDTLQLSLCRLALTLHANRANPSVSVPWAPCARMTVEKLIAKSETTGIG